MGSKLLPQPLVAIPRNPTYSPLPPVKLGFRHSFSFSASRASSSRALRSSFSSNLDAVVSSFSRHRLVPRAEPESEAGDAAGEVAPETETEAENVGVVEGEDKGEEVVEEVKEPRKPRVKFGEVIGILNKRAIGVRDEERPIPDLRPGDIIELKIDASQRRRRLAVYKGIVIGRQNSGIHTTIRVRRIIAGVGLLTTHQGDKSGQKQKGQESKIVLSEGQASEELRFLTNQRRRPSMLSVDT
ncbi:hypothetical protein Tsubulata_035860 [Turnera subulata]|uniref:Uncharacterized protein n=1 Tax=Turnera subulata TaxID=218843 RepID=A0A9Q0GDE6_9ROSI|nr:hypothetical protein Tsubulata_035860 [Turnera subulata]